MAASESLFQHVYDLGERMCAALEADRTESFVALARQRALLVDRLQQYEHPREVAPDWEQWRDRLAEQHDALTAALAAQEQRLSHTVQHVGRLRTAHERYRDEPTLRDGPARSISA